MSACGKWHVVLVALAMAMLVAGCGRVTTALPLQPDAPPADREQWEGTWQRGADTSASLRFTCDGIAHIARIEWDDDHFKVSQSEMVVAAGKRGRQQRHFLSYREQAYDGKWADSYYLAQYQFDGDGAVVIWLADPEAFRQAVESKRLQGDGTWIRSDPKALLEFIDAPENMTLFDHDHPFILKKVAPAPPPPNGARPTRCGR